MLINLHESKDSLPQKKSYYDLERELFDLKFELAVLKSEYTATKYIADFLEKQYLKPKRLWGFV